MFKVLEVPENVDLSQFSRLLWQRKIPHRIHHVDPGQVMTVSRQDQVGEAIRLFRDWQAGTVRPAETDSASMAGYFNPAELLGNVGRAFLKAPLTLLLIITCIVLAFVAPLNGMNDLVRSMLYPDFSYGTRMIVLDRVLSNFSFTQFLQMLSPILLHGGLVHLSFNMLWLWEFGRRIEAVQASWVLFMLIATIALVSNSVQFLYGGTIYFGGMSGVVYGLFGYIWMWQLFDPRKRLALPGALIFFLLLSLVVMTAIDLDFIADEAHIGGMLSGVLYGAVTATVSRIRRSRTHGAEQ
jgi:GlpG protein